MQDGSFLPKDRLHKTSYTPRATDISVVHFTLRICPAQLFLQVVFSEHALPARSGLSHDVGILFSLRGSDARRPHSFP